MKVELQATLVGFHFGTQAGGFSGFPAYACLSVFDVSTGQRQEINVPLSRDLFSAEMKRFRAGEPPAKVKVTVEIEGGD